MTSSGDVFSRFARRLAPPPSSSSAPPLPSRDGLPSLRSADGGVAEQDGLVEDTGKVNKVIKDNFSVIVIDDSFCCAVFGRA